METVLFIFIIIIIGVAFIYSRKTKLGSAEKQKEVKKVEKEFEAKEDNMTYGQVQQQKKNLLESVEIHLADKPEQVEQLKQIINDWAELKIKSFTNRRSWVRNPDKD
ncbi:MAG: hypothetical protein HQ510_03130 [Candidatus Marinimicrobia bacterium]|nr:hypothetical protein [Candidatus Neomarinimicrobiota bacterium]